MSKPANKKAIGAFVVVGLALAVGAIVVFGSGKFFTKQDSYVAFFKGSVKGLRVGAPVVFRGVTVGEVVEMMILADRRDRTFEIPVIIEVERDLLTVDGVLKSPEEVYTKVMPRKDEEIEAELEGLGE